MSTEALRTARITSRKIRELLDALDRVLDPLDLGRAADAAAEAPKEEATAEQGGLFGEKP